MKISDLDYGNLSFHHDLSYLGYCFALLQMAIMFFTLLGFIYLVL